MALLPHQTVGLSIARLCDAEIMSKYKKKQSIGAVIKV